MLCYTKRFARASTGEFLARKAEQEDDASRAML
jgi:hypothetical protein